MPLRGRPLDEITRDDIAALFDVEGAREGFTIDYREYDLEGEKFVGTSFVCDQE